MLQISGFEGNSTGLSSSVPTGAMVTVGGTATSNGIDDGAVRCGTTAVSGI